MHNTPLSHALIAYDLLSAVSKNTTTYNIKTNDGLNALKQLALRLAERNVKSLRGTFEQSKLVGFCLTTNWFDKNKEALLREDSDIIRDLFCLSNSITGNRAENESLMIFEGKETLDSCVTKGFQSGIKLGVRVIQNLPERIEPSVEILIEYIHKITPKKVSTPKCVQHHQSNRIKATVTLLDSHQHNV